MSTEFKKGDRVLVKPGQIWQWNNALPNDPALVVTKTEGDSVHYRYESIEGEHRRDTELFTERAHLVTDTTPAPLDPGKVKAGDTVTLEMGTALVRDVVIEVKKRGEGQFLFYTGETPDPLIPGTYYLVNPGAWTLTAHTPGPEPEPEWKPGTVADIEIWGDTELRAIATEERRRWHAEDGNTYSEDGEVSGVRPLVVIDPDDVDADALQAAVQEAWRTRTGDDAYEAAQAVLGHLGLNR